MIGDFPTFEGGDGVGVAVNNLGQQDLDMDLQSSGAQLRVRPRDLDRRDPFDDDVELTNTACGKRPARLAIQHP